MREHIESTKFNVQTVHCLHSFQTILTSHLGQANLTRIIHETSTAVAYAGMSTALCSLRLLDVLFKYACGVFSRTPCIHACLHHLATNLHE